MFMPTRVKDIQYYSGDEPIFDAYGIEDEIARALSRKVPLPSGGYLIIDQAEALTAIVSGRPDADRYPCNVAEVVPVSGHIMNFQLDGRLVSLCGPDDGALAACTRALTAEGAVVTDGPTASADIVIAEGRRQPGSDCLEGAVAVVDGCQHRVVEGRPEFVHRCDADVGEVTAGVGQRLDRDLRGGDDIGRSRDAREGGLQCRAELDAGVCRGDGPPGEARPGFQREARDPPLPGLDGQARER